MFEAWMEEAMWWMKKMSPPYSPPPGLLRLKEGNDALALEW